MNWIGDSGVRSLTAPTAEDGRFMPPIGFVERVAHFAAEERLIAPDGLTVVGVSGGVDSVVLLHVLLQLDFDLVAAHVNYGLRGAESDEDEHFVRSLCIELGVPLESARYDTTRIAAERGQSVQEVARDLRYAFFCDVAAHGGSAAVAVAHHADDQAETVLLNLFRGTGIEGLAGMPYARPLSEGTGTILVRPLLKERRAAIEAYARERGLAWREDPSNLATRYRRGAIRTEILPLVISHFGEAVPERIARCAELTQVYLRESLDPELASRFETCSIARENGGDLLIEELLGQAPAIRTRLILEAIHRWLPDSPRTAAAAAAVDAIVDAQVGRRILLDGGEVWRERKVLRFQQHREANEPWEMAVPVRDGIVALPGGSLEIRREPTPVDLTGSNLYSVVLDRQALGERVALRPWRDGDRIRPLGMKGEKKVSDLLTDCKIPSNRRRDVLVVISENEIVWVIGVRLAHSVRVTDETKLALRLTYSFEARPA